VTEQLTEHLLSYETTNGAFMNELIAGDEIWVHHVIPEAASGRS
jgi:hypothetical protein